MMPVDMLRFLAGILFGGILIASSSAQEAAELRVAIHDKPPYAFKDTNGNWTGLSVDLWNQIAKATGRKFQYLEVPFSDLIPSLVDGRADLALGELMVTPESEQLIDFSQPFIDTHAGVAVSRRHWAPDLRAVLAQFWDWQLWKVLLAVLAGLSVTTILVWLVERRRNPDHFGGNLLQGLGSALWFSTVTMTSVGYGDKAPVSLAGRVVAGLWMFAGLLLLTAYTAAVASTIATTQTRYAVSRTSDLGHYLNGVMEGSDVVPTLNDLGAKTVGFPTLEDALDALMADKVETVAGDALSLRYLATHQFEGEVILLPMDFMRSRVAFGLPEESDYREAFNVALLHVIGRDDWAEIVDSYLGSHSNSRP